MKSIAIFLAIGVMNCLAQPAEPAFEAASVRLSDPAAGNSGQSLQTSPGMLTVRHSALSACILFAWQFQDPFHMIGPDWIHEVRLDITAKAATPAGDQELAPTLKTLLKERMGVTAHIEKREMAVFALTLAKEGPKFHESTTNGPPVRAQDNGAIVFQRFSVAEFAMLYSKMFGRPVVDATGLKGRYDFGIDLAALNAADPQDRTAEVDAAMTAMQDQLGLKIENRKQAVEFLVIDHAEKTPTEN